MSFLTSLTGSINISTDKKTYLPGEMVTGTIALELKSNVKADHLLIRLKGKEKSELTVGKIIYTEWNPLVDECWLVQAFESEVEKGKHAFDFSVELDEELPGSFTCGSGVTGYIKYELEAELVLSSAVAPNLSQKRELNIAEAFAKEIEPLDVYEQSKATFLMCISKGEVGLTANFSHNARMPGEPMKVKLLIDNSQSKVEIQHVTIAFQKVTEIFADVYTKRDEKNLWRAPAMPVKILPGGKGECVFDLTIPIGLRPPTTGGRLVKFFYQLKVSLSIPWSKDIHFGNTIDIYSPELIPTTLARSKSVPEMAEEESIESTMKENVEGISNELPVAEKQLD